MHSWDALQWQANSCIRTAVPASQYNTLIAFGCIHTYSNNAFAVGNSKSATANLQFYMVFYTVCSAAGRGKWADATLNNTLRQQIDHARTLFALHLPHENCTHARGIGQLVCTMLYCLTIISEYACFFLLAVVFCMPIFGKSSK